MRFLFPISRGLAQYIASHGRFGLSAFLFLAASNCLYYMGSNKRSRKGIALPATSMRVPNHSVLTADPDGEQTVWRTNQRYRGTLDCLPGVRDPTPCVERTLASIVEHEWRSLL